MRLNLTETGDRDGQYTELGSDGSDVASVIISPFTPRSTEIHKPERSSSLKSKMVNVSKINETDFAGKGAPKGVA
jgi:hypothetical protein